MKQLVEAVTKVMLECKGVEKALKVGKGNNAYQGVSAKDVFLKVSESMANNGLAVFPIDIEEDTQFQDYVDSYGNKKNRFFTKVKVKYELSHVSGESKVCYGIGHGADALDKACGKAMTYALKTFCIYQFFIATGHIDDTDTSHSADLSNETQKPNGFKDKRIDPHAHGDELLNQLAKLFAGIHTKIGKFGQATSFDDMKGIDLKEIHNEFLNYLNLEREFDYLQWVVKKLADPAEVWNADRLGKLKDKVQGDKCLTSEIEAVLNQKMFEVSQ